MKALRVIELAGLAPVPFCGQVLADNGADVILVDRPGASLVEQPNFLNRGKRRVVLDLKDSACREVLGQMLASSDVLLDPFRPGVLDRLGLSKAALWSRNARLVIARITGYGCAAPEPYASAAGHDLNYVSLSGFLPMLGQTPPSAGPPQFPGNLLADFAGGGLLTACATLAAVVEARATGRGAEVDCSMAEGVMYVSSFLAEMRNRGTWSGPRGTNLLDGGAPFYSLYECAGGGHVAVGALEPKFYAALVRTLGLDQAHPPSQQEDDTQWPQLREALARTFATRTRDEWARVFAGVDACVTPALEPEEAPAHPLHVARRACVPVRASDGSASWVPAPAPRVVPAGMDDDPRRRAPPPHAATAADTGRAEGGEKGKDVGWGGGTSLPDSTAQVLGELGVPAELRDAVRRCTSAAARPSKL